MPYKDLQRKQQWEQQHRSQRLSRRRELRRIEAAQRESQPQELGVPDGGVGFFFPLVAGGALIAAYNSKLAIGAGGVTLLVAALYKKGWLWWIAGLVVLAVGLFFLWNDRRANE